MEHQVDTTDQTRVIFVTGASRSGTTMMSRVFAEHSMIHASNELHYFGDLFDPNTASRHGSVANDAGLVDMASMLMAREIDGIWRADPTGSVKESAARVVAALSAQDKNGFSVFCKVVTDIAEQSGKTIACDHTPRNIFYASKLLDHIPQARIVHIVRDPRAVLASQKHRWKRRWLDSVRIPLREALRNRVAFHPFTTTKLWSRATASALALADHPRFMLIKFEDIVSDPQKNLPPLCEFLGIPMEQSLFNVQVMGSSHGSSRLEERSFDKTTVERWRQSLRPDEIRACEKLSTVLMNKMGYSLSEPASVGVVSRLRQHITYPVHLAATALIDPKRVMIQLRAMMRSKN